jgi:hypothetical protein
MTVFTASSGGITVKADDGDVTDVSFLLDLDMRTGTLVDSTEWLKGYGSTYPGGSDMSTFAANNTDGAADNGNSAPAATGGALPALNFHAEAAVDNLQISLLVLA